MEYEGVYRGHEATPHKHRIPQHTHAHGRNTPTHNCIHSPTPTLSLAGHNNDQAGAVPPRAPRTSGSAGFGPPLQQRSHHVGTDDTAFPSRAECWYEQQLFTGTIQDQGRA